jgi:hypothetical protein
MGNKQVHSHGGHMHNGLVQLSDFKKLTPTTATSGTAVKVVDLPSGAWILDIVVQVLTAFNSSPSDTLQVGTVADADHFLTAANCAISALKVVSAQNVTTPLVPHARLTADTPVMALWTGAGTTAATAGDVRVAVMWTYGARQDNE